jgi:hypothetical protein
MPNQHTNGPGPIALQNRDVILNGLMDGKHVDVVAAELGIAPSNISKHLANDGEYKLARELGTERRLNHKREIVAKIRQAGFDSEGNPVGLSQEQSNLARVCAKELDDEKWFAEREHPHRWGAKQQMEVNHTITLDQTLKFDATTLLQSIKQVDQPVTIDITPDPVD